jgi:hypothetical protein
MEIPITTTAAVTTTTTAVTTTTTSTQAFVEECEQRTRTYVASHIQPRYDAQQQQEQQVPMNGHEDDTITIMVDGHRKHLQQARGKVRDRFWMDSTATTADDDNSNNNNSNNNCSNNNNNILVLRTTDRQSGFDRMLAVVPYKGAVLNLCSQYWFQHTSDIIHNHLLSVPHPTMAVVRKCQPFPIEFVVRYVTLC